LVFQSVRVHQREFFLLVLAFPTPNKKKQNIRIVQFWNYHTQSSHWERVLFYF
jgi:hypothetical protein